MDDLKDFCHQNQMKVLPYTFVIADEIEFSIPVW
jgi:hypothetical protein